MDKKLRVNHYFDFSNKMRILNKPLMIGTFLGVMPLLLSTIVFYLVGSIAKSVTIFPSSFDHIILDDESIKVYENGRVAV